MAAQIPPDLHALHDSVWDLDQFVTTANRLLPTYLPKEAAGRASDEVNARLVRHYATQGLIAEARKEGREARYLYQHMLQLLTVRKLLAEGYTTAAVKQALDGRSHDELRRLLEGSVKVELVPAGPPDADDRLEFLRSVRARAGLDRGSSPTPRPTPGPSVTPPAPAAGASLFAESHWTRISILDGLDLFVRDDFTLPTNRLGDAQLTQLLQVVLLQLEQRRKGST